MGMISGHQIELSDGRHVFYAQHEGHHYFRFRSAEGAETKFKLSDEANDALIQLLTDPKEVSRWILHLKEKAGSWEQVVEGSTVLVEQQSPQENADPLRGDSSDARADGLAPGCCSASSPCEHQKRWPDTLCDICQRATLPSDPVRRTTQQGGDA